MAVASRNLLTTKAAFVKESDPYTHINISSSTNYKISGSHSSGDARYLMFGLDAWPDELKRNAIYCVRFRVYRKLGYGTPYVYSIGDFDADTVTYATMPTLGAYIDDFYTYPDNTGAWAEVYLPSYVETDSGNRSFNNRKLFDGAGFAVSCDEDVGGSLLAWYLRTVRKNGNPVYVEVTYDDSVQITSNVNWSTVPSGTVNSLAAQTFKWQYGKAQNGYCADETWEQASAALKWKASDETSWHTISISGSATSYDVPAGTFPAGKTITVYLTGTDTEGTTTNTTTRSFTTAAPGMGMTSKPSGSNYDTRQSTVFAWTYGTRYGDLEQASANLFWRESGGSWNTVSVSGNVKTLTVPENTFPTGKTVEWYMTAVGTDGAVATLDLQSFSTASSAITATIYPSGNNVESGQPLRFEWAFRNTLGDYEQSSASLFWRASTSDPWQEIQASGGTQGMTVPKNTFPGNASTVTWYLVGTDIGGTTTQTREQSFKTVTSKITPQNSPQSGYCDPRNAITFSWFFETPTASYDQASAVFHWRISGDEEWTTVSLTGNTTSITIEANTFPVASTIEWYISGTDAGGCSSETEVYSFSTEASTCYAICVSPVGKVADGTKEITLSWIVTNSDGTDPARMYLWWKTQSESQSQWHLLLDTTEQIFSYTAAPDTFTAGPIEWRVMAVNRDGVSGPENIAAFVVLRAPDAPAGLSATAVPRTTVRWQSVGQEGYEVEIDGVTVAAAYGPEVYRYQQEIPLEDGVHRIRVRIQGSLGLWSSYAETSILVENTPEGALSLSGAFGVDAVLTLADTVADGTEIQWYRDGKRIGRTVGVGTFTDRYSIGLHRYYAEIWLEGGNYTRSNTVEGVTEITGSVIADAAGGDWISIRLSKNSKNSETFSWGLTSAVQHITATAYPVLELSTYEDLSGDYNCAFSDQTQAVRFEALRGKTVVLKSKRDHIIIGGLVRYTKQVLKNYINYAFSIQQIHWEDFVDGADS